LIPPHTFSILTDTCRGWVFKTKVACRIESSLHPTALALIAFPGIWSNDRHQRGVWVSHNNLETHECIFSPATPLFLLFGCSRVEEMGVYHNKPPSELRHLRTPLASPGSVSTNHPLLYTRPCLCELLDKFGNLQRSSVATWLCRHSASCSHHTSQAPTAKHWTHRRSSISSRWRADIQLSNFSREICHGSTSLAFTKPHLSTVSALRHEVHRTGDLGHCRFLLRHVIFGIS